MQSCFAEERSAALYEPEICEWPVYTGPSPLEHEPCIVGASCILSEREPATAGDSRWGRISDSALDAFTGLTFREKKKLDRFSILALAAAKLALNSSSHDPEALSRCGVFVGNAMAGWTFTEPELRKLHTPGVRLDSISPYLATAWFPAAAQGQISIRLGLHGFSKTIATDRCAGSQAIGLAYDQILLRRCSMAVAGGVEAPLTPFVKAGFSAAAARDNLAEGAAFIVMQPGGAGRVRMRGHRLGTRPRGAQFTASWLAYWLSGLPTPRGSGEAPLVICSAEAHSQDERISVSAVRNVFQVEPELPLRSSGDALAASAAAGVTLAIRRLESCPTPRSALALCVGARYLHAIMLETV